MCAIYCADSCDLRSPLWVTLVARKPLNDCLLLCLLTYFVFIFSLSLYQVSFMQFYGIFIGQLYLWVNGSVYGCYDIFSIAVERFHCCFFSHMLTIDAKRNPLTRMILNIRIFLLYALWHVLSQCILFLFDSPV